MFLSYIVFYLKINCSKKNKQWRKKIWKNHAKINPGRLFFAKLKNIHVIFEAMFAYRNTENKISVGLH